MVYFRNLFSEVVRFVCNVHVHRAIQEKVAKEGKYHLYQWAAGTRRLNTYQDMESVLQ